MSSPFTSLASDNLSNVNKNLLEQEAAEDKVMFHAGGEKKAENREQKLQQKEEAGVSEKLGNRDKKSNMTEAAASFLGWKYKGTRNVKW